MNEPVSLVRYDEMCRAIDAAHKVDEVKDIRDRALAIETYARQAINTDAERRACEIRLRAERRAGQLLKQMADNGERATPGSNQHRSSEATTTTLNELGISKDQSSRWQQVADLPEDEFEAALASEDKPSTASLIAKNQTTGEPVSDRAIWLLGQLRDFERHGHLASDPEEIIAEMIETMQRDTRRLAPLVRAWLEGISNEP